MGLAHVLYAVEAFDPVVLGAVAGTIALVAVLATLAPARRAAAADPVAAMRSD
jgi:ABC-type lipoprotein release transport system permease subunit